MTTTLYRNGRVRSPADPFATALLVDGGTVAWVGSEAAADAMSATVTVDLQDGWLAPAFVDAHVHTTTTGLSLVGLDLASAPSLAALLDRVEQAARRSRGAIVLGTGWEEDGWPERRPPTAAELDRASYGGVVYLARTDCHSGVASSALLAAAPEAAALPGFEADGLVKEEAHSAVRKAAFAGLTSIQRREAQRAMRERAASLGIACLH
jgi:predicted amidohydrolase YtcJ